MEARGVTERALAAWTDADAAEALHALDREVLTEIRAARWLVLDMFLGSRASARDLFNACARLGGLMGAAGASPSLAASAIDGAVRALRAAGADVDDARLGPARAACFEGYVAAIRDAERAAASEAWEYPACVVTLSDGEAAVACGYPEADPEALAAWAGRVAGKLSKAKVRRVVLSGTGAATSELMAAAELVGIQVMPRLGRGWLPWRR